MRVRVGLTSLVSSVTISSHKPELLYKADRPLLGFSVLVKGFNLSYHSKETILFTIDACYGNLKKFP